MKVLFLTYPRIGLNKGGLQVQIEKTAESLSSLGVEVIFYNPWKNQVAEADICHIFGLEQSMYNHFCHAVRSRKPVIISPVFNCFNISLGKIRLKIWLAKHIPGMMRYLKTNYLMLGGAAKILALNKQESNILTKVYDIPVEKVTIVPNGIEKTFGSVGAELFYKNYGIKDFVLEVGSIGKRKNQLTLIKAIKNLPYKLVIIGSEETECHGYLEECKSQANENVIFTGQLKHDDPLLASAYSAAKVFVLPSHSEVMPLTLYEAAQAGCALIASNRFPIAEQIEDHVTRVAPDDTRQLAKAITLAMSRPRDKHLQKISGQMPTWQTVAGQITSIYEETLKQGWKPR
jgi:glycosyltransferase involved in cell wall biosynthesis